MIAVVGTGSWGTAAAVLAAGGSPVVLWGRDPAKTAELARSRRHPQLEGTELPSAITVTSEAAALAGAELVLWAVPTQHSRAVARILSGRLPAAPLVSLAEAARQPAG